MELIDKLLAGDRRAIARLITMIESGGLEAGKVIAALYPHTGWAYIVGVTGAPGTGKSTLVTELAKLYRKRGRTVGIIAVDPTSPFSGGAFLGDRIRMQDLSGDLGVFIRSMATRGSLGGLARATADAIKVLDAAGFQMILVETVGTGQAEVDIAKAAHTTIVVTAPGLGDEIQALKSGITEIADVFVVNKADREGVDRAVVSLEITLDFGLHSPSAVLRWRPPVCKTVALYGKGVGVVVEAVEKHRAHLQESGEMQRRERERIEAELRDMISREMTRRFFKQVDEDLLRDFVDRMLRRELDPYSAVATLLEGSMRHPPR